MKVDRGTVAFSGFGSDPERIWSALKSFAREYGASQRSIPSEDECYVLFGNFLKRTLPNAHVREEARYFYSTELRAMIAEAVGTLRPVAGE